MSSTRRHFQGKGKYFYGSGSITISSLAASAQEDLSISDSNAEVGDVISVTLANADMEDNLAVAAAWVSADGTIKIRIANLDTTNALTGGSATVYYTICN